MLKKSLSILLAMLTVIGCMAFCVSAADGDTEEPVKTDSGYYIGQILKPGDKITSVHDTCEMLTVRYAVNPNDAEFISSALQKKYASEEFVGITSFRDVAASFTSGDIYAGSYTVKGIGDVVDEMETANGTYKTGLDLYNAMKKEEQKKLKGDIVLSIDYEYAKTTFYQYTSLTGWEITSVIESATAITILLQAVYETREPNKAESFVEKLYSKWLAFLDVLGNALIKIVPKLLAFWAKILGNK